ETEPADTEPKSNVATAGEYTSTGSAAALPVPRSTDACGEPAALLTTVRAPVKSCAAVGVKTMSMSQPAPAASVAGHVDAAIANPAPLAVTEPTARSAVPLLARRSRRAG